MKKIIKISLLSLAVNILLLHSFVPHHHSENGFNLDEILKNEPVNSAIDLLKVGFHINLGTNHLDNYQNNNSALAKLAIQQNLSGNDILSFSITDFQIDIASYEYNELGTFLENNKLIQHFFISSFSYRGPPSLI